MDKKQAPYAPPSAVLKVINHYRSKDVPEVVTVTNLMQIGVTEALVNRTMNALKFLDLVQEDGTTTDQFRSLRYANAEQYQEVLGGILDAAYKDVFDHVTDLATATDKDLNNAFIPYSPGGQRGRMITLFLELAKEAGHATATQSKTSAPRPPSAKKAAVPKPPRKDTPPPEPSSESSPAVAFGVTDSDLAALPDAEFDDVWSALGKLARARAKAARSAAAPHLEDKGED